jgi:hypothetical protein
VTTAQSAQQDFDINGDRSTDQLLWELQRRQVRMLQSVPLLLCSAAPSAFHVYGRLHRRRIHGATRYRCHGVRAAPSDACWHQRARPLEMPLASRHEPFGRMHIRAEKLDIMTPATPSEACVVA